MNYKLTYCSTVTNGRLQKSTANAIRSDLAGFEGKRVEITISRAKSKRSTLQNALYWVYVTILADELGYTKQEMHDVIKYKFLKYEKVFEKTGEILMTFGSTTQLSRSDFADLIDELQRWAAESLGVVLPEPGKQIEML